MCWAKRGEAQRAQSAIMKSLTETKEFDKLKIKIVTYKFSPKMAICTHKIAHKTDMQILWIQSSPKTLLDLWKDMYRMQQN